MMDPVLVEVSRTPLTESVHRGAAAVVSADGRVIAAWGDVDRPVFPRSAIKFIQALPLIESGAADAFGVTDEELALACASHNGEPRHVEIARAWLARIGLTEADLHCGPHPPSEPGVARALYASGVEPTRAHNNCSGKHVGFLTTALHLGLNPQGYAKQEHPIQERVRAALGDLAGLDPDRLIIGNDGCGACNYALPLQSLARAFARLSDPRGLDPARAAAVARLSAAIRKDPFLIAGTDRACTRLITAATGETLVKVGAEGVFVATLPAQRLGIAVKIADGAARAAEIAIATLLHRFGALPDRGFLVHPLVNTRGEVVGHVRAAQGWP